MIGTIWTRILAAIAGLGWVKPWHMFLAAFMAWTGYVGAKAYVWGEKAVVERSKKEGAKNAKASAQAHDRARSPGSADRVRAQYCRDC